MRGPLGALALAALVSAAGGCKREEAKPAASSPQAPAPAPVADAKGAAPDAGTVPSARAAPRVSPEVAKACAEGLGRALTAAEKVPPKDRLVPVLQGIAEHCEGAVGPLARAAREASQESFPRRAQLLAAAAQPLLPPTCVAGDPAEDALEISYACPPPDSFSLSEPLLKDLDGGTYIYALALREQLGMAHALDERADRLLSNLVLAGALQGEQRQKSKPVKADAKRR